MKSEETTEAKNSPDPSPGTREHNIQIIKSRLIPALDTPEWQEEHEPDDKEVERSATILAEEYYDIAVPAFQSFLIIILCLLMTDFLLFLETQVYGLFISIWASIVMVFPSLKGRYVIATAVQGKPNEAIHRLEAQEVVTANVGFVVLAVGFIFQLFSEQFLTADEVIQANRLVELIPQTEYLTALITGIFLLFTAGASSKVMSNRRSKRLESRKTDSQ